MNYTDVKNMVYANENKTLITCDVKFDAMADYIPFTASPDDTEVHGINIYNDCMSGTYGNISDYIEPVIQYELIAEYQRQSKLSHANNEVKDWRTELELGTISDKDKKRLTEWMQYIKSLKSLDFSNIMDKLTYESIQWPEIPS